MLRNTNNFDNIELMRTVKREFSDRGVRDLPGTYFSRDGCLKITISERSEQPKASELDRVSSEYSVIQHNLYDPNYHGGEVLFKGPKYKAKKFFKKQIKLAELLLE
jgi:hypothetical protein